MPFSISCVCGVERLAEFHDVDAALTERGPIGGDGVRRTRRDLKLELARNFLRHLCLPCL